MRIVYVAPEKLTADRPPALQILHTVRALSQMHSDLEFVTPWPERFVRRKSVELTGHELPERLRIVSVGSGPDVPVLSRYWPSQVWSGLSRRLVRHAQSIERMAPAAAIVYTRHRRAAAALGRADCPSLIFEYHEPESVVLRQRIGPGPIVDQVRCEELAGVRNAAALVTVSQTHADQAEELYGFAGMTCAIPNGADPELLGLHAGERRPRLGQFLYVGSLEAWKGLPLAIEATSLVRDAQLHICGGSPGTPEWSELSELSQRPAVIGRVHLHGHVAQHQLKPWLVTSQAGVLPIDGTFAIAEQYTCPLKLLEYMMAGLPCIASDLSSVRELMTANHEGLLFADRDAGQLAGAFEKLIASPETAERLSRNASAASANFTWERRAERILSLCERVAPAASPAPHILRLSEVSRAA